jgi:hypothetical protein
MRVVFKGNGKNGRARNWTRLYMISLFVLFAFGVLESLGDSEGMGFLPLLLLTTPWSWLLMGVWDAQIWGTRALGKYLAVFITCNVISGVANGLIIFILINWRQRRDRRRANGPP